MFSALWDGLCKSNGHKNIVTILAQQYHFNTNHPFHTNISHFQAIIKLIASALYWKLGLIILKNFEKYAIYESVGRERVAGHVMWGRDSLILSMWKWKYFSVYIQNIFHVKYIFGQIRIWRSICLHICSEDVFLSTSWLLQSCKHKVNKNWNQFLLSQQIRNTPCSRLQTLGFKY